MNLAIITGASVGIGFSTAERFVEEGYRVINVSRRSTDEPSIEDRNCDLSNLESVTALAKDLAPLVQQADHVCLVHNACKLRNDSADNCPSNELLTMLNINIVAINEINQHLIPVMPEQSSILYIGSTLSEKAVPNSYSYVVSKHALVGLMRASCQDLMGRSINTNCICPGFTDTEMLRTHLGNDDELIRSLASNNAYDRLVEPQEIAELIWWCHRNPVVNGSVIHANLGQRES